MLRMMTVTLCFFAMVGAVRADELMPVTTGDEAPDFEITGIDGKPFRLSERLRNQERSVVVLFSRAHW